MLEGKVDPVQAGVFLIALRMTRETDDEHKGVLQVSLDATETVVCLVGGRHKPCGKVFQ
ncbi:MAG: hypothetical protein ACE5NW_03805 [Acidiferrobacterales bacterium]